MPSTRKATRQAEGEAASKVARRSDVDREKVLSVVLDAEEVPALVRQMLLEGLPHASAHCGGERHEYQSGFLGLVDGTLKGEQASAAAKLAEREAAVEEAGAELQQRGAARDEAKSAEESARTSAVSKASLLHEANAAVAEVKRDHDEAEAAEQGVTTTQVQLETQVADVSAFIGGPLKELAESGLNAKTRKKHAAEAVEFLESIRAEKTLVAAVPNAFLKEPESRGEFDAVTASCTTEFVTAHHVDLEAQLAKHAPAVMEAASLRLGLWAMLDTNLAAEAEAKAVLAEAKDAHEASTKALKKAETNVTKQEGVQSKRVAERSEVEARAADLEAASQALARITEGVPDVEDEEMAPAEAAPVEAEAAPVEAEVAPVEAMLVEAAPVEAVVAEAVVAEVAVPAKVELAAPPTPPAAEAVTKVAAAVEVRPVASPTRIEGVAGA